MTGPWERFRAKEQAQEPEKPAPAVRGRDLLRAIYGQGIAFGFGDEIEAGARSLLPGRTYDEEIAKIRADIEAFAENHPALAIGSELYGAVVSPGGAIGAIARGGKTARAALHGAAQGGVYGAGKAEGGAGERLTGATTGGILGGALGAGGSLALDAGRAAFNAASRPVRRALNPSDAAARDIQAARVADRASAQPGLSRPQMEALRDSGVPVMNMDMTGETGRSLARFAANVSPPARDKLNSAINQRFETQQPRVDAAIRRIAGGDDAGATRESLRRAAQTFNDPAYAKAYSDPAAQGVWDEGLEQLAQMPEVQNAIRKATLTGRSRGALRGFPPLKNPFVFANDGRVGLSVNERGEQILPNLQFWDHVKRNLDSVGTPEARDAARILREHLDELVPAYRAARRGAAEFFGAEDALEAGRNFVSMNSNFGDAARALAKMSPADRAFFREGFAAQIRDNLSKVRDRRDITNSVYATPKSRRQIELVFGRSGARDLEVVLHLERLMDAARPAVQGNSTTVQQQIAAGLATTGRLAGQGGAGAALTGFTTGNWDPTVLAAAFAASAAGGQKIDRRYADRLAEMLTSRDPAVMQKAIRAVARNDRLMDALRRAGAVAGGNVGANADMPMMQRAAQSDDNEGPDR